MGVIAFIVALVAAVVFGVAIFPPVVRANLIALGLCLLTAALILQFTIYPHPVHN